jgi:hypothetical protein
VPVNLSPEQERLVAAVERDYEVTHGATASAETAVIANRSVGFTLIAALIGVGLTQKSWPLMTLAAVSALFLYTIDGYYSWRAEERRKYLQQLEDILSAHVTAVVRTPNNAKERGRLDQRLASLRVGVISKAQRFKWWRDPFFNQPGALFWGLYPLILIFAIGTALYLGFWHGADSGSGPARVELCIGCVQRDAALGP